MLIDSLINFFAVEGYNMGIIVLLTSVACYFFYQNSDFRSDWFGEAMFPLFFIGCLILMIAALANGHWIAFLVLLAISALIFWIVTHMVVG